jgi:hypothetical protein
MSPYCLERVDTSKLELNAKRQKRMTQTEVRTRRKYLRAEKRRMSPTMIIRVEVKAIVLKGFTQ